MSLSGRPYVTERWPAAGRELTQLKLWHVSDGGWWLAVDVSQFSLPNVKELCVVMDHKVAIDCLAS